MILTNAISSPLTPLTPFSNRDKIYIYIYIYERQQGKYTNKDATVNVYQLNI